VFMLMLWGNSSFGFWFAIPAKVGCAKIRMFAPSLVVEEQNCSLSG
jgi:hypothetical protein